MKFLEALVTAPRPSEIVPELQWHDLPHDMSNKVSVVSGGTVIVERTTSRGTDMYVIRNIPPDLRIVGTRF